MRRIDPSTLLFAAVSITYPLLAAVAVRFVGPGWVVAGLFLMLGVRVAFGLNALGPKTLTYALIFIAGAVALIALFDRALSVRLYPVLMNGAMLAAFAHSLWRPPSMIERFARIAEPELPETGVRYTRAVTWVWVGFFVLNGAIALWTALFAQWGTWALYNGGIAYGAMGALFVGEWAARPFFHRATGDAP